MKKIKKVLSWVLTGAIAGSIVLSDATPAFSSILGDSKKLVSTPSNATKSESEESNSSNNIPAASKQKAATASNATRDEYKGNDSLSTVEEKSVSKSAKKATSNNASKKTKGDRRVATPSNADRAFSYMAVVDGYRITIRADEGVFTEQPSVKISKVTDTNNRYIEDIIEQKLDPDTSIASIISFDISFYVNSEEVQPDGDVEVVIELADGNEAEPDETAPKVFHVSDDYTAEEVPCEVPESGTIKYFASQFSTYSVVLLDLESDYVEIWTVDDLKKINTDDKSLRENYRLMQDIDLKGVTWVPIGKGWAQDYHPFSGSFDGNNHTISNLSLTPGQTKSDRYCYGFFGGVDGGEIKLSV